MITKDSGFKTLARSNWAKESLVSCMKRYVRFNKAELTESACSHTKGKNSDVKYQNSICTASSKALWDYIRTHHSLFASPRISEYCRHPKVS